LVTFHADASEVRLLTGGSPRTYYSGNDWAVPLHVSRNVNRVSKRYGLLQVDAWPIKSLNVHCVVFEIPADQDLDQLLLRIAKEPGVDGAQPMQDFEGLGLPRAEFTSSRFALQYGDYATRISALHRLTRGAASRVGMVDTLVDASHPDLRDQIARQYAFVDEPPGDLLHGTAVAGVISASGGDGDGLVGLAPEAKLYVYGACWAAGQSGARCNSFTLAKALEQAIDDGVDVLNLSLSGPSDPLLARQLSVLLMRAVVVAAVDKTRASGGFPASFPGVLAVAGSSGAAGAHAPNSMSASSCAGWIFDPERLSTRATGGYQFFYGSSMSAAAASGFAALLRSRTDSAETARELRTLIGGNGEPTPDRTSNFLIAVRDAISCEGPAQAITAERAG
jgi:subtilisin family serine protease